MAELAPLALNPKGGNPRDGGGGGVLTRGRGYVMLLIEPNVDWTFCGLFSEFKLNKLDLIKNLLKTLMQPKIYTSVDAKSWIQKILLEEKYGKINS